MIWFTSDEHYGHKNIIKYCDRPYAFVKDMDEAIIGNFNSRVKPGDTVYHLGDFTLKNYDYAIKYMHQLNGYHFFIKGSHDSWLTEGGECGGSYLKEIKEEGKTIVLCHYAMRRWPKSHYGAWHLYGHSHGTLPSYGLSYDVGVDNNNFYPVSFEQLKEIMKNKKIEETNEIAANN